MFSRILVPTDFSPPSDAALEYARVLAAKFGSSLQILHVVDDPSAASEFVADGYAPSTENIRASLLDQAQQRLGHLMNLVDRSRYHARSGCCVRVSGNEHDDSAGLLQQLARTPACASTCLAVSFSFFSGSALSRRTYCARGAVYVTYMA